jgi:hypothetical protein
LPLKHSPPEDGWNWSDEWTEERLAKTLEAMDVLAAIQPGGTDKDFFGSEMLNETDDGWQPLVRRIGACSIPFGERRG